MINEYNPYPDEFDERGNCIHYKLSDSHDCWQEFDEYNRIIWHKDSDENEFWFEYGENNKKRLITEEKFKFRKKEKEFLNRKYCSRFEIMDI